MGEILGFAGHGSVYGTGIARPRRGSAVVISHGSALAFWRRARAEDPAWTRELLGELYPDDILLGLGAEDLAADTSLRPLELPALPYEHARHAARALGLRGPVDVVVGKRSARRESLALRCHMWSGPLSDGLVVGVDHGVYVCSPEVVLMQLAHSIGLYRALALAMELCGSYSVLENGSCAWDVASLMSVRRIQKLVGLSAGYAGVRTMRRVCCFALDNSASPRETALAIMLSLPRDFGGYGCGKPKLNAEVPLSAEASRECQRSKLVADLLFDEADLDVEYQGREWHEKYEDRLSDESRQNALMMMGKSCLFVSKEQLSSEIRMEGIANLIRKRLGLAPFRKKLTPAMALRRAQMMSDLGLI